MSPPKSLTCRSCTRGFIAKDQFRKRCPVLLDCGHAVCEECNKAAASKGPLLSCPQCNQVTLVQKKTLPPDAYINGCLVINAKPRHFDADSLSFETGKRSQKSRSSSSAGSAEKLLRPIVSEREKCEECGVSYGSLTCPKCEDCRFCEACFSKVHRGSKLLSRHVPRQVAPPAAAGDGGAATVERCCHLHENRPLEYYCVDDSVAVCSHCSISGEHKGHTVEPVADRNARRRPELEQAAEKARNTFLRLRMAAKTLQSAPPVDVLDPSALLDTIQDHFSQLHGQLQLRQLQLSSQLLEAVASQRAAVRDTEASIDESCDQLRGVLAEAEAALAGAGGATLDLDPLLEKLAAAAGRPCHLIWPERDAEQCQVRFLADKELLTSIGEHGKLEVEMEPPVRLLAESDLPLDHVVKDITPEMLAEADDRFRDAASVCSETSSLSGAAAAGPPSVGGRSVELVGMVSGTPARLTTSPRPPDSRLAAVFPPPPPPPPPAATGAVPRTQQGPPPAAAAGAGSGARRAHGPTQAEKYGKEEVMVTHIKSPALFYVQRCAQERQLQDIMRRVAQWCSNPDILRNMNLLTLGKNEPCLAQYTGDKRWYRARIIDVYPPSEENGPTEYEVFYIDFGNQERVLGSALRPMTAALARDPDMAVACTLWDLVPADGAAVWSPQATHAFASLVRGEPVMMTTIRQRNQLREVDLLKMPVKNIETDTAQSVRDHLVFIELAAYVGGPDRSRPSGAGGGGGGGGGGGRARNPRKAVASSVTVTRVESAACDRRQYYAAETVPRGSQADVLVSHVDSPEAFYVQQLGVHAEYLTNMMNEMQRVYLSHKAASYAILNPQKGQVCAAQFSLDGKFYRAEIELLLPHAMVDVCYVDYGNRERIPLRAVRKIEDKFMVIPKQAIKCRLADVQPADPHSGWLDAARQCLIEATDGKTLKMYIDSVDECGHVVTLYECRPDADICINALLARLSCVRSVAPSTRRVEYTKVGWEPSRELPARPASTAASREGPLSPSSPVKAGSQTPVPGSPARPATAGSQSGEAAASVTGGGSVEVFVSHCESPDHFCVQIADEIPTLNKMMKEMQHQYYGGAVSSQGYTWKPDDVAVARCAPDRLFYRIRVVSVSDTDPDSVKVYLIDYGKTETVKQGDIMFLLKQFEEHRAFAMACHLYGIRPAGDRGVWTGFAIDFLKNMLDQTKKLFLVTRLPPGGQTEPITSLPCDLEAEEYKNVGALEPIRRIRTSLSGKLVEQGLAFSKRRGGPPSESAESDQAAVSSLASSLQQTVLGTRPEQGSTSAAPSVASAAPDGSASAAPDGSASAAPASSAAPDGTPSAAAVASSSAAPGSSSAAPAESSAAPAASSAAPGSSSAAAAAADVTLTEPALEAAASATAESDGDLTPVGSDTDEQEEIPLGADWATLSGRRRDRPQEAGDAGGVSGGPGEPGELERSMLENERAAEAVQERPLEDDWLPARMPAESRFRAQPTHVTMAGTIYLHTYPKGKQTLDIITQALKSKYADSHPRPCDNYWFDGQPCIAKYYLDGNWYRAKVLQVHQEKVSIQFVDYGNTDRVELTDLRKNIFMEHVPIQALHCELYNIVPLAEDGHFSVKTLNFIHTQIVERECQVEVHHFNAAKKRFTITLSLVDSGINVNELLVQMGDARYMTDAELAATATGATSSPLLEVLVLRSPYRRLALPAGDLVPVTAIAALSPALVLVQPQRVAGRQSAGLRRLGAQLDAVENMRDRLAEQAPGQPPLARPTVGAPCLCQYSADGQWYRAVVLAAEGDTVTVQYVDWGNTEEVPASSLREMSDEQLGPPAWTLLLELHRVTPPDAAGWKPEATEAMQKCLFQPDVQLWAKVKQSQRDPPMVELLVFDDPEAPQPTPRLAYQEVVDSGLILLSPSSRRT